MKKVLLVFALALAVAPARAGGKKPAAPPPSHPSPVMAPAAPAAPTQTAPPEAVDGARPVFLSELPNINDFVLFGNGGWDGNWYVGYNTCWVSKLPPAPAGRYSRAFLGAKLGRMKTEPVPGRPSWERRPIRGEINIAVAGEPLWPQSRRFLLAETQDIPLEGDTENAVEGVGESRWFWVEVPLKFVSFEKDNYVALFSPSEALSDARHAPILAAGWGDTKQNTWLNSTVKGQPPIQAEDALKTAVTYFEPAVALKLVPANDRAVTVTLEGPLPEQDAPMPEKLILSASVAGQDVESAWVEFSTDTRAWNRAAAPVYGAPYVFTVKRDRLPPGKVRLRAAAQDLWGNKGASADFSVQVPVPEKPKKKSR